MARHKDLAQVREARSTGMRVFLADPRSPWQRSPNENTNELCSCRNAQPIADRARKKKSS